MLPVLAVAGLLLASPELSPPTLKAYERYVSLTELRIRAERAGTAPAFWIDRQPERIKASAWQKLRRGEVIAESLETRDNGQPIDVPDGRIHHWVATTLLPGVPIDRVLAVVRDYDRYPQVFAPLMTRAKAIEKIDKSVAQKSGAWIMEDEGVLLRVRYLPAPDLRRRQGSAPRSSRPRPS